jgi:hypothetical protein
VAVFYPLPDACESFLADVRQQERQSKRNQHVCDEEEQDFLQRQYPEE